MAPSLLSFLFILVIIFPSPLQIEARESKFFSKVIHNYSPAGAAPKEPAAGSENPEAPVYAPTTAPAPAPGPVSEFFEFQPDTQDGYGLYGRGSNEVSTPSTTTTTVGENEVVQEESYPELEETSYSNNNGYSEYYNNNGNTNEKQGMSDTRFMEDGRFHYNVNGNGEPTKYSNNNNGYYSSSSGEKQGMSDTRFLENGRYSYDYTREKQGVDTTTSNESYYSNSNDQFNSMEENQEEYQEDQEEYVP